MRRTSAVDNLAAKPRPRDRGGVQGLGLRIGAGPLTPGVAVLSRVAGPVGQLLGNYPGTKTSAHGCMGRTVSRPVRASSVDTFAEWLEDGTWGLAGHTKGGLGFAGKQKEGAGQV